MRWNEKYEPSVADEDSEKKKSLVDRKGGLEKIKGSKEEGIGEYVYGQG